MDIILYGPMSTMNSKKKQITHNREFYWMCMAIIKCALSYYIYSLKVYIVLNFLKCHCIAIYDLTFSGYNCMQLYIQRIVFTITQACMEITSCVFILTRCKHRLKYNITCLQQSHLTFSI